MQMSAGTIALIVRIFGGLAASTLFTGGVADPVDAEGARAATVAKAAA